MTGGGPAQGQGAAPGGGEAGRMLLCPDCHVQLTARAFHTVVLHVCPECAGIWFGGGGLEALQAQSPAALLEVEHAVAPDRRHHPHIDTDRWCPSCPRPLERYTYATGSPIQLDACPLCHGTWVEKGELAQIHAWIETQRLATLRRSGRSEEDMALEMARFTQEHEEFMAHARSLTTFFRLCARRGYLGWW